MRSVPRLASWSRSAAIAVGWSFVIALGASESQAATPSEIGPAAGAIERGRTADPSDDADPEDPEAPRPTAVELRFEGAGGIELVGTLLRPARVPAEGVPAVLLIPGSGPTDRDGSQPPIFRIELLRLLAERLADEGVASFRFDKRALAAYADLWPDDLEELGRFFSFANFVGDAEGAFAAMRAAEGIDRARTAIAGHSEGGLIALGVATRRTAAGEPPAGVALLATPGRPIDEILREQIRRPMELTGRPLGPEELAGLEALDAALAAVRDDRPLPAETPPVLRPLFNPTTAVLLRELMQVDLPAQCAALRGPALVLIGAEDAQVSPVRDARPLAEWLVAREPAATTLFVVVPATSHNLKGVSPADRIGFRGPVVPAAMDAFLAWTRLWSGG
ncbi:MAG TPA: alpha/beta fold hydrolase [Phycisphaerales bacterium]|nr:alpha/beta fold hydrolase [Phycisphaerales bacterium]HMP35913.1 alpha/beta fold hydrolase [Phycisphaerales bacterium]